MCPIACAFKFEAVIMVGHLDPRSLCHLARPIQSLGVTLIVIGAALRQRYLAQRYRWPISAAKSISRCRSDRTAVI